MGSRWLGNRAVFFMEGSAFRDPAETAKTLDMLARMMGDRKGENWTKSYKPHYDVIYERLHRLDQDVRREFIRVLMKRQRNLIKSSI